MRRIHSVAARNYRSLHEVEVTLAPLSVLVGPNGSGKSSLLDVFAFLGATARMDLGAAITERGGFERLRFRGQSDEEEPGTLLMVTGTFTEFASVKAPDEYYLGFRVEHERMFRAESFTFKGKKGPGRRVSVNGGEYQVFDAATEARRFVERVRKARVDPFALSPPSGRVIEGLSLSPEATALATIRKLPKAEGATQLESLAKLLESLRVFDVDVNLASHPVKTPDEPDLRVVLAPNASNLASFLAWLSRKHSDVFARIEEDLARVCPGVTRIEVVPVGGAAAGGIIALHERALHGPTFLAEASFGTRRALALLAMLHDPEPPPITCVEEIDHGLHPYALDVMIDRVREASRRTQMLLATHSPALVNRLEPEEIVVCERDPDTGASRIPAIEAATVRRMEQESGLELGELWFSGALGGVP